MSLNLNDLFLLNVNYNKWCSRNLDFRILNNLLAFRIFRNPYRDGCFLFCRCFCCWINVSLNSHSVDEDILTIQTNHVVSILHPLVYSTCDRNGDDSWNFLEILSQVLSNRSLTIVAHQLQTR